MKLLKKLLMLSLFFAFLSAVHAQNDDLFLRNYVSVIWTASDGLPGNAITDIIQKDDGYIYIGTYATLVRFDGLEFVSINKNTDPKVQFVSARTLFQDSEGNLWVGANDEGVTVIKKNGRILQYDAEEGLTNNSVRAISEDKNGTIWIGTSSGICTIKNGVIGIPPGIREICPKNNMLVNSIYSDKNGGIWISCTDNTGLIYCSEGKARIYNDFKSMKNPQISCVFQDNEGKLWFGAAPHFAICKDGEMEVLYDIGSGVQKGTAVSCIFQDSRKNMWFGRDSGISILSDGKFYFLDSSSGLTDNKISKIIEDKEGNMWIGTDRGGVQKFSPAKFKTYSTGTAVNAIAEDSGRKGVWFGADDGLKFYKNGTYEENRLTEMCKNIRIRHVGVTEEGEVLVSTYERLGQLVLKKDGSIVSWTKDNGFLCGNKVRVAIKASDGKYYVGTTSGLSIIDEKSSSVAKISKQSGLSSEYIMCLYEDESGKIWAGTDGGGVFILENGQIIKILTTESGIAGNVVFKILKFDYDDTTWLCTGSGITGLKNDTIINIKGETGLNTDSVFQIIADDYGKIWATSNSGIFSISKDELKNFQEGFTDRVNAKYYTKFDGITSGGVTSTSLSMKDSEGRIWFTLIDGFTVYDPVKVAYAYCAPEVLIQSIKIDGKEISPEGNKIVIPPSGKRLSIKYTGFSYSAPEKLMFKYRLEGFDKDFSDWSGERNISYTNLRPGNYKFTVIAQNNDEVISKRSAGIEVVKKPAFWQLVWFWILVAVAFAAFIVMLIRHRLAILKKENQRLENIYLQMTKALTGTIDAKDPYTNGHSSRVADYSKMIAERMGLPEKEQKNIYMMAILHDIGKIGIPDSIINKPSKLTDEEYEIIKKHPVIGSEILRKIESLKGIETGARWHHERYDGKGYPDHLKGEEIPLEARIIGVADAYDAMTSSRSYRKPLSQDFVRNQIEQGKGTQFDPVAADKMLELMKEDVNYELHG